MWVLLLLCAAAVAAPPEAVSVGVMHHRSLSNYTDAVQFAVHLVNTSPVLLPNTTLEYHYADTGNTSSMLHRNLVSLLYGNIANPGKPALRDQDTFTPPLAVIGPVFADHAADIGAACSAFGVPNVNIRSALPQLSNKHNFPTVLRVFPSALHFAQATARLLVYHGWRDIIVLHQECESGREFERVLRAFTPNGTVVTQVSFIEYDIHDSNHVNDPRNLSSQYRANIDDAMRRIGKMTTNIIILYASSASQYLWLSLHRHGVIPAKQILTSESMLEDGRLPPFSDQFPASALRGVLYFDVPPVSPAWDVAVEYEAVLGRALSPAVMPVVTAVLLVAEALHSCLYTKNSSVAEIRGEPLFNQMKITALVDGWSDMFFNDKGDRLVDLSLINIVHGQTRNAVGTWYWGNDSLAVTQPVLYHTGLREVPLDVYGVVDFVRLLVSAEVRLAIRIVCYVGMVISGCLLVFNIAKRNTNVVRLSSAHFNSLMLIGGCMLLSLLLPLSADWDLSTEQAFVESCFMRRWLFSVGFTIFFGSLFVKNYRVWRVCRNPHFDPLSPSPPPPAVPDMQLFLGIFVLVMVDMVVLFLWGWISPSGMVVFKSNEVETEPGRFTHYYWNQCDSDYGMAFAVVVMAYKLLLVMYGAFIAVRTRHVKLRVLNDSRLIAFSTYNVALFAIISIPLAMFAVKAPATQINRDGTAAVTAVIIFMPVITTELLVFGPKIYHIVRGTEQALIGSVQRHVDGSILDRPDMVRSRDIEKRKKREKKKKKHVHLRRNRASVHRARPQD